jgi:uncharacterized protein
MGMKYLVSSIKYVGDGASYLIRNTLYLILFVYQRTLSPDHGLLSAYFPNGYCRFHPTCSMYARDALRKHGMIRGLWMSGKRVLRCNPFSHGGVDVA